MAAIGRHNATVHGCTAAWPARSSASPHHETLKLASKLKEVEIDLLDLKIILHSEI